MSLPPEPGADGRDKAPLRVGLLLDAGDLPSWVQAIVSGLSGQPWARLVVVLRAADVAPGLPWAFGPYSRWDARHIRAGSDPLERLETDQSLASIPVVRADRAVQAMDETPVDVLLDLRAGPFDREAEHRTSFGTWHVWFGPRRPACFWEVVGSDPLTRVELRAAGGSTGASLVLGTVVVPTSAGLSWARNRLAPYWSAVTLVLEKLRELHDCGWERVARRASPAALEPAGTPPAPASSSTLVSWLARTTAQKAVRRLVRRPQTQEWRMAIRESRQPLLSRETSQRVEGFRWLTAPSGRHWADPFLLEHGGRSWCFFEDIDRGTGRGRLSAFEIGRGAEAGEVTPVLELPYHLSYPCLVSVDGDLFMIPESSKNQAIELYRCHRFPDDWRLERVMRRDRAVDTTALRQDGRWWFFTTRLEPRSLGMQLWLFSAESLTSEWVSHPENPISMDVRNARGAGAIVHHEGRLYRPSQDCSIRYGRTFSLNEIVTLTPDRYEERPVLTVEPMAGLVATHTYARCGALEMIDGCALLPSR